MLKIHQLSKSFGATQVLNNIELQLKQGDIGVLLGTSGSGKTTLLRIIAGLENRDHGGLILNGEVITDQLSPSKRHISFLFQNFALFPHLNAADNVALAIRKLPEAQKKQRINEVLAICDLSDFKTRFPHQLSGGQQQRLALARALAPRPQLLLMDEPFSGLDPELRLRLCQEVRILLKAQGVSALVVTHQIDEAYDLGDQVSLLDEGRIIQTSTPYDMYHRPSTPFVAKYFDRACYVDVDVDNDFEIKIEDIKIGKRIGARVGAAKLLLRPDDIIHDDHSSLHAKVLEKNFRGANFLYALEFRKKHLFYATVPSHHNHAIGSDIGIRFDVEHLLLF